MISDGSRVSYIGSSSVQYDEQGVVLAIAGKDSAHVKWDSGKITLCTFDDLVPLKSASRGVDNELDDSLEVSGLSQFTAETIYNERGPEGLLEALEESGALYAYDDLVEDALESLIGLVSRSGWLQRLDEDNRHDMAALVARELFKRL